MKHEDATDAISQKDGPSPEATETREPPPPLPFADDARMAWVEPFVSWELELGSRAPEIEEALVRRGFTAEEAKALFERCLIAQLARRNEEIAQEDRRDRRRALGGWFLLLLGLASIAVCFFWSAPEMRLAFFLIGVGLTVMFVRIVYLGPAVRVSRKAALFAMPTLTDERRRDEARQPRRAEAADQGDARFQAEAPPRSGLPESARRPVPTDSSGGPSSGPEQEDADRPTASAASLQHAVWSEESRIYQSQAALLEWAKDYAASQLELGGKALDVEDELVQRGLSRVQARQITERYFAARFLLERHAKDVREIMRSRSIVLGLTFLFVAVLMIAGALLTITELGAPVIGLVIAGLALAGLGVWHLNHGYFGPRDEEDPLGLSSRSTLWKERVSDDH